MNETTPAADASIHPPLAGLGRRPGWRFLVGHPAHAIALGFGSGLAPRAPGTAGTLAAWLAFAVLQPAWGPLAQGFFLLAAAVVGIWACTVTAQHLADADPPSIVWDEFIAFWLVLWLVTPASVAAQAAAFVVFRVFDAAKPGPVAWADARWKGRRGERIGWRHGFGILVDDLVAALCTLVVIAVWRFVAS